MNTPAVEEIISLLGLQTLPLEGGYFRVTYTADEQTRADALPERYSHARSLAGAIYFLVTCDQFSAMHKLPTDEIYYYHLGEPLEMLFLHRDGSGETKILGPDIIAGQELQVLAPRYCWHGSRPLAGGQHGFSLVSTSMAPGFDKSDPVFAIRNALTEQYPAFSALIASLTRLTPHNT